MRGIRESDELSTVTLCVMRGFKPSPLQSEVVTYLSIYVCTRGMSLVVVTNPYCAGSLSVARQVEYSIFSELCGYLLRTLHYTTLRRNVIFAIIIRGDVCVEIQTCENVDMHIFVCGTPCDTVFARFASPEWWMRRVARRPVLTS